jgi:serine/threonine-protein kinase RsbW
VSNGQSHEQGAALISLTVPAKPEYVIVCRLALDGVAEAVELSAEAVSDLKLAVTEACANSIAHAYPEGDGAVTVDVSLLDDRVLVEVIDDGVGIPEQEVHEFREDDELRESGMGLALISALFDDLEIGTESGGRGTRIAFSKPIES